MAQGSTMADLRNKLNRMSVSVAGPRDLDEGSSAWRRRAGRESGPDSYVPGDVCRSVLLKAASMSARQREEAYGGPVVLVGVVEARGLPPVVAPGATDAEAAKAPPQATYVQLDALDATGHSLKAEKGLRVRTVMDTTAPQWDEVLSVGARVELDEVASLRLRVLQWNGPFAAETRVGEVVVPMAHVRALADANTGGGAADLWLDVSPPAPKGAGVGAAAAGGGAPSSPVAPPPLPVSSPSSPSALGRVHVMLLLHHPPPDPVPLAVHVRVVEARNVLAANADGTSDPYLRVAALTRRREPLPGVDATAGGARRSEVLTQVKAATLSPVWNEGVTMADASVAGADGDAALAAMAGGQWPPVIPEEPFPSVNIHVKKHATVAEAGRSAAASVVHGLASLASGAAGALRGHKGVIGGGGGSSNSGGSHHGGTAGGGGATPAGATPADGVAAWDHTQTRRFTVPDLASEARYLRLTLHDHEDVSVDRLLGQVVLSFSSLFGDEEAVVSEHTLRLWKWHRVRPVPGRMDAALEGTLGHLSLDITLVFAEALLPPGWSEAVDETTGESYYHCHATGASQWEEPAALTELLRGGSGGGATGGGGGFVSRARGSSVVAGSVGEHAAGSAGGGAGSFLAGSPGSGGGAGSLSRASMRLEGGISMALPGGQPQPYRRGSGVGMSPSSSGVNLAAAAAAAAAAATTSPPPSARPPVPPPALRSTATIGAVAEDDDAGGGGDDADGDDGGGDLPPAGAAAAAEVPLGGGGGAAAKGPAIPDAFVNPLAALAAGGGGGGGSPAAAALLTAGDREKAFLEGMRAGKEEKKRAEEAAQAARLAAMTPEERAEWEAERGREARREQRKDRMLKSSFAAYGGAGAKASVLGGGAGGRGGGAGRPSARSVGKSI